MQHGTAQDSTDLASAEPKNQDLKGEEAALPPLGHPPLDFSVQVDIQDPSGHPIELDVWLTDASGKRTCVRSGTVAWVAPGPVTVHILHPPGQWTLQPLANATETPTRLSLRLADMLVWLGDPGGRDFGGLPVIALSPAGQARGRIGIPFPVWAGPQTLLVGNPVAGVALKRIETEARPQKTSLELGRLGALVVHYRNEQGQDQRGWPIEAHFLEFERDIPLPPLPGLRADETVQPSAGHTGEALTLWPGLYRIQMADGPETEVDIRGGHLTELDFSGEIPQLPQTLDATLPKTPLAQVQRMGSALSTGLKRTARGALQVGLASTFQRLGLKVTPVDATPGGVSRPEAASQPPTGSGVLLQMKDARGYTLTGKPFSLLPLIGTPGPSPHASRAASRPIHGRIGVWCEAPKGRYQLQLEGHLPRVVPLELPEKAQVIELPPLGALEVIVRDGLGCSLRGASYVLTRMTGSANPTPEPPMTAALSQLQPLEAGRYRVEVPTRPPLQREVEVQAGKVEVIDLGALGQVDTQPGPDAAWGTPLLLRPDQGLSTEKDMTDGPASPSFEALPAGGIEVQGYIGQVLHVPPGAYRCWLGKPSGAGEVLEVRAGRMRRPTVVGRGFEALASEDANRK